MTSGWEPGSSTASSLPPVGRQSSEPESPDAAIIVCPCRAIREKIAFSAAKSLGARSASQSPQLVVTTCAVSSLAIRLKRSMAVTSLSEFGAS